MCSRLKCLVDGMPWDIYSYEFGQSLDGDLQVYNMQC